MVFNEFKEFSCSFFLKMEEQELIKLIIIAKFIREG
ncbi:hypothetical protein SRA_01337 [Streptococcus ratti FA-1 = DSM 20564]|uniref:Uncharacterized protein n=1 Tax=Streptococcus ratti FA-1 = DSM 20564 TaxID=699248 RepID=A0ABN0GWT7_STRRT|nr:hypothetical protein SRA_08886 [Streptococcus ratti FA-1 = DSM 20564]EJN94982.1 hypothetical protein SRA_01337 [Streptococcus ratti FA-1 = DSM 20564]